MNAHGLCWAAIGYGGVKEAEAEVAVVVAAAAAEAVLMVATTEE